MCHWNHLPISIHLIFIYVIKRRKRDMNFQKMQKIFNGLAFIIYKTIQIGENSTKTDVFFDCVIVGCILLNLALAIFETFEESVPYREIIDAIELFTTILFTIEYGLRIWTAKYIYPEKKEISAIISFIFSFFGIVDLLTFLPYFLPFIFPGGAIAFKMFRVIRVFKLFRINTKYDAFNVIVNVLNEKKMQLL